MEAASWILPVVVLVPALVLLAGGIALVVYGTRVQRRARETPPPWQPTSGETPPPWQPGSSQPPPPPPAEYPGTTRRVVQRDNLGIVWIVAGVLLALTGLTALGVLGLAMLAWVGLSGTSLGG